LAVGLLAGCDGGGSDGTRGVARVLYQLSNPMTAFRPIADIPDYGLTGQLSEHQVLVGHRSSAIGIAAWLAGIVETRL
jgi:hypothetical protein